MKITEAREAAKTIVIAATDAFVAVVDHIPDQVSVPSVLIGWRDPWLTPSTVAACQVAANLEVIVVAQRIEPGGQLEQIETLVADIWAAFVPSDFVVVEATAPFPMTLAGVDYLASSLNLTYDLEE